MDGKMEYYLVLKVDVTRAIDTVLEERNLCPLVDLYSLEDVYTNRLQLADFYIVRVFESDVEELWYDEGQLKVIDYDLICILPC